MSRFRSAIVALLAPALTAGVLVTSATPAAAAATIHWSTAYYVAWEQGAYPPSTLPWNDFSVLIHFSVKTSAARNGTINTNTHGMTPAFMQAAVAAAHQHGRTILLSIGGAEDKNWDAACSAAYRATFISNLVSLMQTYGYDGIDLDVEQDFGSPAHVDFIACVAGIRNALNGINPRLMLTEAADPSWMGYMIAPVAQYLDQINFMSYWGTVDKMPAEVNNYTSRGVPLSKIAIGLGLDPGMADVNLSSCQAKTAYAASRGLGVMEWIVTDAAAPQCMAVVGSYLSGVTPPPTPAPTPTPTPTPRPTPTPTATPNASHSATPSPAPRTTAAPTSSAQAKAGATTAHPSGSSGAVALRPSNPSSPASASTVGSPTAATAGLTPWFILLLIALGGAGITYVLSRPRRT